MYLCVHIVDYYCSFLVLKLLSMQIWNCQVFIFWSMCTRSEIDCQIDHVWLLTRLKLVDWSQKSMVSLTHCPFAPAAILIWWTVRLQTLVIVFKLQAYRSPIHLKRQFDFPCKHVYPFERNDCSALKPFPNEAILGPFFFSKIEKREAPC